MQGKRLEILRGGCVEIANAQGHTIAGASALPDHLHLIPRGNIEHSPLQIALAFLSGPELRSGGAKIWRDDFQVGIFRPDLSDSMGKICAKTLR